MNIQMNASYLLIGKEEQHTVGLKLLTAHGLNFVLHFVESRGVSTIDHENDCI